MTFIIAESDRMEDVYGVHTVKYPLVPTLARPPSLQHTEYFQLYRPTEFPRTRYFYPLSPTI
jgi:hypothetical protein